MNTIDISNNFYFLTSSADNDALYKLNILTNPKEMNKRDVFLYAEDFVPNTNLLYEIETFNLPFHIRKNIICTSKKDSSFFETTKALFDSYNQLIKIINKFLLKSYENVYLFCSIFRNDFCLLVPKNSYELDQIKQQIKILLELDKIPTHYDFSKHDLLNHLNIKTRCIKSDRQFVKHNPMFSNYLCTILDIESIACDSIDRTQELSLFSSLVLKDLVEETHLYWLYDSGDLRYVDPGKAFFLKKQNSVYFEYYKIFCEQAKDNSEYNDWIWVLVFLTQKLLNVLINSPDSCIDPTNFYGFIPIIKDLKPSNNEVISLFTRHISRKFCHGFLIIPTGAIINIIDHLPAYIHEFFHYIPPRNRAERNSAILDLIFHSVLFDLRKNNLNNDNIELYDIFFKALKNEFLQFSKNYCDDIGVSDSMEYIEALKMLFSKFNFVEAYDNASNEIFNLKYTQLLHAKKEDSASRFLNNALDYISTFTLFLREIRSDIAMCDFLGIDLKNYIRILANEPLFAHMDKDNCGDSTILRFGYMCHYLFKNQKDPVNNDWLDESKMCIAELLTSITENESNNKHSFIKQHYNNLLGYLDEYNDISIEKSTSKRDSLLENILEDPKLIPEWEKDNKLFTDNSFIKNLKELYQNYKDEKDEYKRLITICGAKILFRDFYSFEHT